MKKIVFLFFALIFSNLFSLEKTKIIDCKDAMAVLDRTVKNFKSFEGKFFHRVTSSDGKSSDTEEGVILLKKGGKAKFVYSEPEGKIAVSNGKTAYLYLKEDNCVYKINILFKSKMPLLAKIVLGQTIPSKEFFCAFAQKTDNILRLELGSKEKDLSLRRIEVEIDEKTGFFSKISYIDQYDQKILFSFFEGKSDIEIPDYIFEFTPPKGAKILESKEDFQEEMNF